MEATTIPELMAYCQADPDFFEPPWHMRDEDSRLAAAGRPCPPGWRRRANGLWVVVEPEGGRLPEQGWKIHVSATAADADAVCDLVSEFCLGRGVTFKFLRSTAALRLLNSKYADRGGSGKLLTLYPADESVLARLLPELAALLKGFTGPYVLSDVRYEDSPVYVRYGAFVPLTYTAPGGELVYAVRAPDGTLVPDRRDPVFTVPEWVTVPEVLRASVERRTAGGEEFPYLIEKALHFSNGGGVYLARSRESGGYVVLVEARPHAGLDHDGSDAVTRLTRERKTLERLSGLDCVPRVLGHLVVWEHHFLVEEYIEGETLLEEVFARYPLGSPEPSDEWLAEYTRWATDVLAKVDRALMAVHARGVRFADLHPANIIVRPDGRVALIDFEIATDLDDPKPPPLGAPGFTAPEGMTGREADEYAMNCLRQWMFLPISPLQERDPVKYATLTDVVTAHFPVPEGFGARLVRKLGAGREPFGEDTAARLLAGAPETWPAVRDALVAGIHTSATPGRADRLFPGDPQQFGTGGLTVASGAAGVLWALRQVGAAVPEEYVDWLTAAVRRAEDPRPGLMDGLHGVAAALETLGRRAEALEVLDRARALHAGLRAPGIHSGLAGAGLGLLGFAALTGDTELRDEALSLGESLAAQLERGDSPMFPQGGRVGLEHGLTGVAYFFLRLYEVTGDPRFLEPAGTALRRETDRGQFLPDGGYQMLYGNRRLVYLGPGSGGLALVLARYLDLLPEGDGSAPRGPLDPDPAEFARVIAGVRHACRAVFVRHPALFMGRAGLITTLGLLDVPEDRPHVREHVRRLSWHAVSHEGRPAFPGNQLLRLSMDLDSGSAGVLVALGVAFERNASIVPFLDLRAPAAGEPVPEPGRR
ncbi:class III lanthionine synthetase LanKC [Streptomyces sp. NPDC058664]|uniref:class III lanthionine synthetase LanKC n=1 Tax=unclassified Streptomyces TaxID=2593676 RepID=UPI0036520BDF